MRPADGTAATRPAAGPGTLATRLTGTAGPAVGWIHGYTMDSSMFDGVWRTMPGYRHIGIDLPGHGGSPDLTPQTTMDEMACGVAHVMAHHGARLLVAVSLGSMAAFEVAIRRLCPLDGLAVIAPALVGMPAAAGTAERYRTLTRMHRAGVPPSALVQLWMSSPPGIFAGLSGHPAPFAALRSVIARHSWRELDFGGPAAFYRDAQPVDALPGSARSLLVMSGEHDMPEFRDLAEQIEATVRCATVLRVPGAGHLPLLEDPAGTVGPLARFLDAAARAGCARGRTGSQRVVGAAQARTTTGTTRESLRMRPAGSSR